VPQSIFKSPRLRGLPSLLGTSRHSATAVLRSIEPTVPRTLLYRATSLAIGSMLIGTAVGMLVQADLGLSPYDVLASGLSDRIGMSLGQAGWLMAAILFVLAGALGQPPSKWGLAYVFANGLATDASSGLISSPETLLGRATLALSAIVVMAIAINLVVQAGTTGGPFELLMKAGDARGVNPTSIRYGLDFGILLLGVLLGGTFGVATVLYAGLMGIVLKVISQAFDDHRYGRNSRTEDLASSKEVRRYKTSD